MDNNQRVFALVVIGVVLAFLTLDWGDQYTLGLNATKIFVFYEAPHPRYRSLTNEYGIYTRFGIAGILLGVVSPLCLFAVAAFIARGARWRT
jgi:hypothetical protein